jgi:cyclopropane fatty-acyl-phospholipid synthase-like methyltransferase
MSAAPPPERAPVEHFERLYEESADPWEYATSRYEQAKYRATLEAVPDPAGKALELGSSIGVFTAMLAPRCERLVAVDFSAAAVERAGERLAADTTVEVERRVLPEQMPEGPFETIVCAEILYYWSPALVKEGLRRIEAALQPGGTLVAVHWRGSDPRRELDGDDVHAILREHTALRHLDGEINPEYILDRWRKL